MENFNCCTDGKLPDLTHHPMLEINAVYPHPDEDGITACEALFGVASGKLAADSLLSTEDDLSSIFYSIYARDKDGFAQALHDEDSLETLKNVAALIQAQYPHLQLTIN